MYEDARPAYERGEYDDRTLRTLLECGAIYPHMDPEKGFVPTMAVKR